MDAVVPWQELLAVVEPYYPRAGGRGRPPVGLASMLRIYFLQQWFALSDRQIEDALYDIASLRRFAGFSNVTAALPGGGENLVQVQIVDTTRASTISPRPTSTTGGVAPCGKAQPRARIGGTLSRHSPRIAESPITTWHLANHGTSR